jgi:hypothetical protein
MRQALNSTEVTGRDEENADVNKTRTTVGCAVRGVASPQG